MNRNGMEVLKSIGLACARREANQSCRWLLYQDKLPDKVKKLKRVK